MSALPRSGFHQGSVEILSSTNSPEIPVADQAIHAKNLFVLLLIPQFFLWILAAGFSEVLHSYLYFFLILDFQFLSFLCSPILTPVKMMVKGSMKMKVEEELADNPRTTSGT